ncbi:MAG: hypothetical protein ACP5O2_08680 [Bacteroidales bacterium]
MDDLLTILLVVGWIVLGIFQNSRKQKKIKEARRQATMREEANKSPKRDWETSPQRPPEHVPAPVPEMKEITMEEPDLEDVLGELLGMPSKPKPLPRPQPAAKSPVNGPAGPMKTEPYSPLAYTPLIEQINKPQYESIEFREEHMTPGYHIDSHEPEPWSHPLLQGFDPRQAVIYSAILHRPYP